MAGQALCLIDFLACADILGGSATYFSLAASAFTPVRMVGAVGEDFPIETAAEWKPRGIDVAGISIPHLSGLLGRLITAQVFFTPIDP